MANATIYLLDTNETFPSLPGLFGRYMADGKIYAARLQFLPENPFLCEHVDRNNTSFVKPAPLIPNDLDFTEPVALLASRGGCTFSRKAAVAQAIDQSVQFLLVYDFIAEEVEGEDEQVYDEQGTPLVPMFTEYDDTRLILLSVSHRTGQALRQFIKNAPEVLRVAGGPTIALDGMPPMGYFATPQDLRQMIMSAIGLFFMLVSFSGCIMILVGTYGQMQPNGQIVFSLDPSTGTHAFGVLLRTRLTLEQVRQLPTSTELTNQSHGCAICLDEEDCDDGSNGDGDTENRKNPEGVVWTVLPCQHCFHPDCITPWLTERQAKCPLCKFDVLMHVLQHPPPPAAVVAGTTSSLSHECDDNDEIVSSRGTGAAVVSQLWTRLTRYRWTRVSTGERGADSNGVDGIVVRSSSSGVAVRISEVELSSQQQQQQQHRRAH
jgi:hypothetical protein